MERALSPSLDLASDREDLPSFPRLRLHLPHHDKAQHYSTHRDVASEHLRGEHPSLLPCWLVGCSLRLHCRCLAVTRHFSSALECHCCAPCGANTLACSVAVAALAESHAASNPFDSIVPSAQSAKADAVALAGRRLDEQCSK